MGAIGPSFKHRFIDTLPTSNADLGITIARLLDLPISAKGKLTGRYLSEATPNGQMNLATKGTLQSEPDELEHKTVLIYQKLGNQTYFDAAGYPGRTLGLDKE